MHADLLIIGSGVAGTYAALTALKAGARVVLATKGTLSSGSTRWAQGGIAFPQGPDDLPGHLEDTLTAGRGLSEPQVVQGLLEEALLHKERLLELGVPFDPTPTREGGHRRPRVLHAWGDATGHALLSTLLKHLHGEGLEVLEHHAALALVQDGARVVGAEFWTPGGGRKTLRAGAVLLATGGLGRIYPVTTNPHEATGDGFALAYRAGAVLRDMEFVQFHPTALPTGGLVTEAARGEGALLVNARGERFMPRYDPAAELAPRDVVARAIYLEAKRTGGVFLDLRPIPNLPRRFPTVWQNCLEAGHDPTRAPVPVHPAAHYAIGGVKTDPWGRTTLPGLFAVGEVASSGLHGANRLASNSLLEGLVMGARAAQAALEEAGGPGGGEATEVPGLDPNALPELRRIAHASAGIVRERRELEEGLERLARHRTRPAETLLEAEAANLRTVLELILKGALFREESRGAHYRADHPQEAPRPYHLEQARGVVPRRVPL